MVVRNKKIFIIIFAVAAILALWFFVRFIIGGPEDTWFCDKEKGEWVKHGVPSAPMPTEPCGEKPVAYTMETKYIRPQEWPPKLQVIDNAAFSCQQGGLGINGRPGMTIQKKINDTVYCIENVSEGTAGTFYTDYTYTFLKDNKLVKLSFTLAYPECDNYNDPQKTECEKERQTFDLDVLINRIAESVQL